MNERRLADLSRGFNQQLVNLLDSLSALSALGNLTTRQGDERFLLKQALAALMSNQDMERCSIFLYDEADEVLSCAAGLDWAEMLRAGAEEPTAAALGTPDAAPRAARLFRRGEGLVGEAAARAAMVHCPSCRDDPRFMHDDTPPAGSLLCMPIVSEAQVLGVLNVFHPQAGFFDLWHEHLLQLFAQSLGRLLVNYRLSQRLHEAVAAKAAEIERQKNFIQSVLDSAPQPMMVIGRDYRILMTNRAARARATALDGNATCYRISHHRDTPCDGHEHPCPLQRVVAEGRSVSVVHEHLDADGQPRLFELQASPLRDAQGAIIGIVESAHDITERAHLEAELQTANARLQEAQRIARIGSWQRDFATDRMTCSTQMAEICGWPAVDRECAFTDFVALIHPDDRQRVQDSYATAVRLKRPFATTHRLLTGDGIISYVKTSSETLYSATGLPLRSQGTLQDVTMQTLAELSLRESEERFRTIADYTFDWEYWEGTRGEILYCSPSCERITGHVVNDFIARPELLYDIIHPDDQHLMAQHRHDVAYVDSGTVTFRIIRRDGSIRWIAHGCRLVLDRDGLSKGRRSSNRDITEYIQS
jgi:PAS domain S-box-containing protein